MAVSCAGGRRCGSDPVWLWLWCRLAAAAPTSPLAWEPPFDTGAAIRSKRREENAYPVLAPFPARGSRNPRRFPGDALITVSSVSGRLWKHPRVGTGCQERQPRDIRAALSAWTPDLGGRGWRLRPSVRPVTCHQLCPGMASVRTQHAGVEAGEPGSFGETGPCGGSSLRPTPGPRASHLAVPEVRPFQ